MQLHNFNNSEWVYEQHRQQRPMDFEVASLMGITVKIEKFWGELQPIVYNPAKESYEPLPHYSTDANSAIQLLTELPNSVMHSPRGENPQWHLEFDHEYMTTSHEFGADFCQTVCNAWLSYTKWRMQNVR